MKTKFTGIVPFLAIVLSALLFASCGPVTPLATETPTATETPSPVPFTETPTPACPPEEWPCPSDSLTLTAVMGATLDAIPSNTPPARVTIVPSAGDLGWGAVYGRIIDGASLLPLEGASVRCEHVSYTSSYPCQGTAITNADGLYSFVPVFFRDTDRITLFVDAPGYIPLQFEQSFFTRPEFQADLGLFPAGGTPGLTSFPMCTPPACPGGTLDCGSPDGCPGGCGTICLTATPSPKP
ncbi:MAG: carboxypeptidase-like regulatory domain-containing protein [Anaerolineales bacterium]